MQIEITEKERTALSILVGLRQKFAKEKDKSYSSKELFKLFSELTSKISNEEFNYCNRLINELQQSNESDEVWDVIDEQINKSKIKRYNWEQVFGRSLTQVILSLKKQGLDVSETFDTLKNDTSVIKFIEENIKEKDKILENLKISIHARYGENNTAQKVMGK